MHGEKYVSFVVSYRNIRVQNQSLREGLHYLGILAKSARSGASGRKYFKSSCMLLITRFLEVLPIGEQNQVVLLEERFWEHPEKFNGECIFKSRRILFSQQIDRSLTDRYSNSSGSKEIRQNGTYRQI